MINQEKEKKTGIFFNETFTKNPTVIYPSAIYIKETDDTYKDITWENSPVELTFNIK